MKIDQKKALELLATEDGPFKTLFSRGSLSVEVYQPDKVDLQQPHEQDEVYIVISGKGEFLNGSERVTFGPGDFLFVPAGVEHRFENFSNDFSTWVIFYGPKGGEKA
jgi:mannose-6-phosphate isomerase-like protein (cupin superfamily)